MIAEIPSALTIATYVALLLAVLSLWIGPVSWVTMSLVAIVLGYASGVLTGPAVVWLALLGILCVLYERSKTPPTGSHARWPGFAAALGIVVVAFLLGTHALPGFHNLLVAKDLTLSPDAAPYTLYLNVDKTMVGVLILGTLHGPLKADSRTWVDALRNTAPLLVLTVTVLIAGSLALGYLRFEPGWHDLFWIWAPANLFFTCLSEEAFFRGFVQRELRGRLGDLRHAGWIAIAVSAVTFGLAHLAGGWTYVFLATVAGAGYALVYARTGRIEMAMLTHFALNATHFLLFTYPRSAA